MYVKVEPSGCVERHGLVQIRLAMYLEPGDYAYERYYVQVPERPLTDKELADPKLADLVPKVWQLNPFHNHFIYGEPDITDDEIKAQMALHLPNFYEAWCQDYSEVKGGMRHGWDVKTRKRPKHYGKDTQRKALVEARLVGIRNILSRTRTNERGEIFPATAIDIGAVAIDRNDSFNLTFTYINKTNPANDTGTIDTVEMWLDSTSNDGANVEVATFIDEGSNVLSTRDSEAIGAVTKGSKQTFSGLDMDVTTGDYIGAYGTDGRLEALFSGGAGAWNSDQDRIPASSVTFSFVADFIFSLYGTGETSVVNYDRSASVVIGVNVSASRTIAVARTASVIIANLVSASAGRNTSEAASVIVGVLVSAIRPLHGHLRQASVSIGVVASAVRAVTKTRTALVKIGVKTTASKALASIRAASVIIGVVTTATISYGPLRTAAVAIGVKVLGNFTLQRILSIFSKIFSTDLKIKSTLSTDLTMKSTLKGG